MNLEQFCNMSAALAHETRAKIVEFLSCGSLCACELLQYFDIAQPTLSAHIRVLSEAGIVTARAQGRWQHYSLNQPLLQEYTAFAGHLFEGGEDCACHRSARQAQSTCAPKQSLAA